MTGIYIRATLAVNGLKHRIWGFKSFEATHFCQNVLFIGCNVFFSSHGYLFELIFHVKDVSWGFGIYPLTSGDETLRLLCLDIWSQTFETLKVELPFQVLKGYWVIDLDLSSSTKWAVIWITIPMIFFSVRVFLQEHSWFTRQQGKGEAISLTPLYHFHPLHRHLHISGPITVESSPLHIASSRTRSRNL